MSLIYGISQVLHRIRVKLYPNYLPGGEGTFLARTDSEASLSVEQVCATKKNRGGFTGRYEDMVSYVKQYFEEAAYQLSDGFAINTGFFSIYPNLGGTFKDIHETPDPDKHPLTFRFRAHDPMRELARHIAIEIEGLAHTNGYIDEFTDSETASVNGVYKPGNIFVIHGRKIKIAGSDPSCGVYFVPVDDPAAAVKVSRIAESTPTRITGIAPATGYIQNRIEIHTQLTTSTVNLLKTPRVITSPFILEEM